MTANSSTDGAREGTDWSPLAEELQALRHGAGDPSYAEIARRVSEGRRAQGSSPEAARVARSTIYDTFRTGRTRINLALVREIVRALDGDEEQVGGWVERCRAADRVASAPAAPPPAERPTHRQVLLLLAACVLTNLAGRVVVDFLELPIYLDMVGTAVAAIALGPWWGAGVGVTTNLLGVTSSGSDSVPFALVNVVGALVWGYGVRRGFGRSLPRFLTLNLLVAAACSVVAVPILVLLYGGSTGHAEDTITGTMLALTDTLVVATGFSNVLVSVGDKMISGFVALVAVSALPLSLRGDVDLPLPEPVRDRPGTASTP